MLSQQLLDAGAPEALTAAVVRLFKTDGAIGIVDLAERRGADEIAVTHAFTHLGEALGLDWAQTLAAHMNPSDPWERPEEHTSELQSLMRISYAVFCLKKKNTRIKIQKHN